MENREEYRALVDSMKIYDNTFDTAYPQTVVADIVREHLGDKNGKKKKVLLYAFDGCRADSLCYIIPTPEHSITGCNLVSKYSAVTELREKGGLYMSYAGGDESHPETLQETSTAQGFASILTGKWGIENGVVDHVTKRDEVPTFLLEYARQGVKGIFAALWQDHFSITYAGEIKLAESEKLPLEFRKVKDEAELQEVLLDSIDADTDIIFGINEFPDGNGHWTGFEHDNYRYVVGVTNADRYAYELLRRVEARPDYENEDWLIIITSDHGGHGGGHGDQTAEDRMTFIATNKKLG